MLNAPYLKQLQQLKYFTAYFSVTLVLNSVFYTLVISEQQVPILCALCQDSVDHPELTDPNTCTKHKFCDDCIIKAFTFSNICPACLDTVGLITSKKQKVSQNQGTFSPSFRIAHLSRRRAGFYILLRRPAGHSLKRTD